MNVFFWNFLYYLFDACFAQQSNCVGLCWSCVLDGGGRGGRFVVRLSRHQRGEWCVWNGLQWFTQIGRVRIQWLHVFRWHQAKEFLNDKWYKMIHPRLVSTECSLQIGCAMQKTKRTWFSLSRYNSVMACQSTVNECGFGCRRGIHAAPKIFGKLARWYSGSGVFGKNTNNSLAVVNALTRLVYKSTTIRSTDNFNDDFNRSVNRFHIRMRFSVHAITRWENSPEQKATCLICVVNLMGVVGAMVTSSSASGVGSAFGSFSLSARPFVCAAAVAVLVVVGLRASLVKRISRWTAWFKSIVFRRRNLYWCNLRLDLYFARCVIDLLRLKRSSSCICTRWLSM